MAKPKELADCKTVGDFIDRLMWTVLRRPKGAINEPGVGSHIAGEDEIAKHVQAAIAFYGPVHHEGRVWYNNVPPRTGPVASMAVIYAYRATWTVEATIAGLPVGNVLPAAAVVIEDGPIAGHFQAVDI